MEHFRHKSRMVQFDQHLPEPTDPRTDPKTLVTEEIKNRVRSLVAELAAKDRRILKALFFDEREKDSICREFGVKGLSPVLLHRAGERFRRLLSLRESASAGITRAGIDGSVRESATIGECDDRPPESPTTKHRFPVRARGIGDQRA